MLCNRCDEETAPRDRRRRPPLEAPALGGGLSALVCARCGTILPAPDPVRRMLEKLSQLSRFGLGGDSGPLLERSPTRSRDD